MANKIVMPQLGLTMTEGSVNTWMKEPGEHVQKGEMLFTVSTDKVDMEVESTGSGFLNTVVDLGKTVPVGTIIVVLTDQPGEKVSLVAKVPNNGRTAGPNGSLDSSPKIASEPANSPGLTTAGSFPASPRARNLAKNLGINIADVTPDSGNASLKLT